MAKLLVSDEYPHGHDLGAILEGIRKEAQKGGFQVTQGGSSLFSLLAGSLFGFVGLGQPDPVPVPIRTTGPAKPRTREF